MTLLYLRFIYAIIKVKFDVSGWVTSNNPIAQ